MNCRAVMSGLACAMLALAECGCRTVALVKSPEVELMPRPAESPATSLALARAAEMQGFYHRAYSIYDDLRAGSTTAEIKTTAGIGCARCLLRMDRTDAAIVRLGELPQLPATVADAERMALAGEAFLRKRRPLVAEPLLAKAMSFTGVLDQAWAAPAYANLGVAFVQNGKPEPAWRAYRQAELLFIQMEDRDAARECREIAVWLTGKKVDDGACK